MLRQQSRAVIVDADRRGERPRGGFVIAGQHHHVFNTLRAQHLHGVGGRFANFVGHPDHADCLAVHPYHHAGPTRSFQSVENRFGVGAAHLALFEEPVAAYHDGATTDRALSAAPRQSVEGHDWRQRQCISVGAVEDCAADPMFGS